MSSVLYGFAQELIRNIALVWSYTWWLILPALLCPAFMYFWLWYIQAFYIKNTQWIVLRVRVPREIMKTPKSMEQVFAAAHATYSFGVRLYKKYWDGEVDLWSSFEIMADAQGPQFYIRIPISAHNMIEAAIYGQYPDAEIELTEDYIKKFPTVLPNDTYDLQGSDFLLGAKNDGLPIRTYEYFELKEEEEKIDTISTLMEALSHHVGDETTWIQFLIRPVGKETSDWVKKAEEYRDELIGRKAGKKPSWKDHLFAAFKNAFLVFFVKDPKDPDKGLQWPKETDEVKPLLSTLTEKESEKIKAIDRKTSKLAFETVIRWVYIDRKERLNPANTRGITAWARQFVDVNLNFLRPNLATYTLLNYQPFKKRKAYIKKRRLYDSYRGRYFPSKFSIMNTEELATLYHFPTITVQAPMLGRIEAKKGTPPASLPVQ